MRLAIKTKLRPNNKQRTMFAKSAGTARFTYNWGLSFCKNLLDYNKERPEEQVKFPSAITLHKLLNATVKPENPWFYEASKCAPQFALRDLSDAFNRFFKMPEVGFPKFKKKGVDDSFTLDGSVEIGYDYVKLPKIGKVRTYEKLVPYKPSKITVSRIADDWFVSYTFEVDVEPTPKLLRSVGIDLGIKTLATLSTGRTVLGANSYKRAQTGLKRLQRSLSRKVKGSKNRDKARRKVAKLHARIANIRKDTLHKLTTMICQNHEIIGIEDLNVSGMMANHKLAKSIADMGFYEFKRQLTYKAEKFGCKLVLVDRWFPSSKTCNNCKTVKEDLALSDRIFACDCCGHVVDRDFNASINIEQEALRLVALETA